VEKRNELKQWVQADPLRTVGVVVAIVASIGVLLWVSDTLAWLVASWSGLLVARALRKKSVASEAAEDAQEALEGLERVAKDESWKEESRAVTVEELTPDEKARLGDELLGDGE
jgi:hypothetical protein